MSQKDMKINEKLGSERLSLKEQRQENQRHLANFIKANGGIITFDQFVEESLYNPERGFYNQAVVIGKSSEGAHFQTAAANPLFAELMARHTLPLLRSGDEFIEIAGGMGTFKQNILAIANQNQFSLPYLSIDISSKFHKMQHDIDPNSIQASVLDLPFPDNSKKGVVFMNESVDAYPFKVLYPIKNRYTFSHLEELCFSLDANENIVPVSKRVESSEILDYWQRHVDYLSTYHAVDINWDVKQRTFCINLYEERVIRELARVMQTGSTIVMIDYGSTVLKLLEENSRLFGFRMFPSSSSVSVKEAPSRVYETDMTTDVNFTNLIMVAEKVGFKVKKFTPQKYFLWEKITPEEELEMKRLKELHPWYQHRNILSSYGGFKVLVLEKM